MPERFPMISAESSLPTAEAAVSVQSATDQGFFSQVLQNLPGIFNWLVYAAIIGVTLIGVIKCLIPLWSTTRCMKRAIRTLEDYAGQDNIRTVWQDTRFLGKRLKGYWQRFLQNAEQLDRRGLPCNVEDYINDDTVTHGPGNAQLAELIPTLLTSLGILGTFMGMVQGLSGLVIDPDRGDAMMQGIAKLLEGMGYAFGTSVAGVSCSLVFNMLNRIAQGSSYRAIDDFSDSFTQLAMQRPLDNDVQLICQNQDRNHLLGEVTENVSGRMATSIELAVGRALHPVAATMDAFLMNATQAQIDGMAQVANLFVANMNESLNASFLELGRTLSEVSRQEQLSLERVQATLDATQVITQDVGRLHSLSGDIITGFRGYLDELTRTRQRDVNFEKSAVDLLSSMQTAARDQSALLASLKREQESLSQRLSNFAQQANAVNGELRETAQQESRVLSDGCKALTGQVEAIAAGLGDFRESMRSLTALLERRAASLPADGTSGATAEALSGLQRTVRGLQDAIERGTAAAGETDKEA